MRCRSLKVGAMCLSYWLFYNVDNYCMVCWFHPIFNVFRFHVKMLFFFDKDKARISARVFKKIAHCQSRFLLASPEYLYFMWSTLSSICNSYFIWSRHAASKADTHHTFEPESFEGNHLAATMIRFSEELCEVSKRASMETNYLSNFL